MIIIIITNSKINSRLLQLLTVKSTAMKTVYLLLVFQAISIYPIYSDSPKLVFLQSIFRHGSKYPSKKLQPRIDELLAKQKINLGQLTKQGKASHYLLGKKMNEIYWQTLFGEKANDRYYHLEKVSVISKNMSRTIESAESHLFGLLSSLPPLIIEKPIQLPYFQEGKKQSMIHSSGFVFGENGMNFHPHPVYTEKSKQNFLQKYSTIAKQWESQNYKSQFGLMIKNDQQFVKAMRKFQTSLRLPRGTINLQNYNQYYNNEECMQSLGYATVLKSPTDIFATLSSIVFSTRFFSNQSQKKIIAGELLGSVISNINNSIHNSDAPQWAINSNHQLAIFMVLQALNITNAQCIFDHFVKKVAHSASCALVYPSFSSILVIEVYEQQKTHFFKVNYNGEHYEIPLCGGKKECGLQKLFAWYESWIGVTEQAQANKIAAES